MGQQIVRQDMWQTATGCPNRADTACAVVPYLQRWVSAAMWCIVLTVFVLPTFAIGASFDCKLAATRVERLICSKAEISSLDDTLSEVYSIAESRAKFPARLRSAQKAWLSIRNACAQVSCLQQQYERRIAAISCDDEYSIAGSAIGSEQCAYFSRRQLEQELSLLEERYNRSLAEEDNNTEYVVRTAKKEQSAWRQYRFAYCQHIGAIVGASGVWNNAYAAICELDETKKRIELYKGGGNEK